MHTHTDTGTHAQRTQRARTLCAVQVTDAKDRRTLMVLLDRFYSPEVVQGQCTLQTTPALSEQQVGAQVWLRLQKVGGSIVCVCVRVCACVCMCAACERVDGWGGGSSEHQVHKHTWAHGHMGPGSVIGKSLLNPRSV